MQSIYRYILLFVSIYCAPGAANRFQAECMKNPVCSISKNSHKGKVLQDCVFVVWDECTMANKISIETVNRTMQDRRGGFRRPCRNTSPECLRRSLQAVLPDFVRGIPELGIPSFDPFRVENLNFILPGGISVDIKEGYTKGLRKCKVDSARNIGGDRYEVKFRCNVITKGKYRSKGQFLMFPIDGEGESRIKCKNLKVTCTFRLVPTIKSDGTQHLQIQDFKSTHDYDGRVSFHLTNLFKGNPEISKAVLKFLNENWRSVSDEFGGPFLEYGVMGILKNVQRLLDIIPINELEAV